MVRAWMLDELAHAGPEHLDEDFVAAYDRKAGFDPTEDLVALRAIGLDATSTLVDLGAGTGGLALAAAREMRHVVAVDISPAMVSRLRERARAARLENLDCVRAGLLSYEHIGEPVDAAYSRNVFHQIPDFWKAIALTRVSRLLRPHGILRLRDLIYDFEISDAEPILDRWLETAVDDPRLGYTRDDFVEHIRSEHSTFRWLFEPMLVAAGFEIVDVEFHRCVYGAYTCIKRGEGG
jgi:SAM-dependent methyltransferase